MKVHWLFCWLSTISLAVAYRLNCNASSPCANWQEPCNNDGQCWRKPECHLFIGGPNDINQDRDQLHGKFDSAKDLVQMCSVVKGCLAGSNCNSPPHGDCTNQEFKTGTCDAEISSLLVCEVNGTFQLIQTPNELCNFPAIVAPPTANPTAQPTNGTAALETEAEFLTAVLTKAQSDSVGALIFIVIAVLTLNLLTILASKFGFKVHTFALRFFDVELFMQ